MCRVLDARATNTDTAFLQRIRVPKPLKPSKRCLQSLRSSSHLSRCQALGVVDRARPCHSPSHLDCMEKNRGHPSYWGRLAAGAPAEPHSAQGLDSSPFELDLSYIQVAFFIATARLRNTLQAFKCPETRPNALGRKVERQPAFPPHFLACRSRVCVALTCYRASLCPGIRPDTICWSAAGSTLGEEHWSRALQVLNAMQVRHLRHAKAVRQCS